jgi:CCR4-NOT transcription complex subunit 7/8
MDSNDNVVMEKENIHLSLSSDVSTTSTDSDSSSSLHSSHNSFDFFENNQENYSFIKEVYASDFKTELKKIKAIIDKKEFIYIGMDTEFPGTIYNINNINNDFYYKTMKLNVNSTKLIQLGITLINKNGEFPEDYPYHTWQFNFKFDIEKDKYSEESINLLKCNGIDFKKLKEDGIDYKEFADGLLNSALVLNPNVKWISYHGLYDFGYLLKILIKENLPEEEKKFIDILKVYIPEYYDVRMLVKDNDFYFRGGLNRLIKNLGIERKGINHQAGSDAIATAEAYHKLIENEIINKEKIKKFKNVLYGIGVGRDNENTIKYLNNSNNVKNVNNVNKVNVNNRNNFILNNNAVLNRNLLFMKNQNQLQQMNNYIQNNYVKCYYPCYFVNTYDIIKKNILLNQMKLAQAIMAK